MGNHGIGSKYGKGSAIPSQSRTTTTLVRSVCLAGHFLPSFLLLQPQFLFLSVAFWVSLHLSLCRNFIHLILALYKSCPFCYNMCP